MQIAYHVMSSPVGLLFLARSERGLRYLEFMDRKSLKRMIANHAGDCAGALWRPSLLELKPVVEQLDGYFNGTRMEFTLPLDAAGSEFQIKVWGELRRIPYGRTRTYGEIASAIGQARASRAVGLANNQNPIAIVVPCHRVIGADGRLVGYGGGVARKKWLLDNEARFAPQPGRTGDLFAPAARPRPGVATPTPVARAPRPAAPAARAAATPSTPKPAVARPGIAVVRSKSSARPASRSAPPATRPRATARKPAVARGSIRRPKR